MFKVDSNIQPIEEINGKRLEPRNPIITQFDLLTKYDEDYARYEDKEAQIMASKMLMGHIN